MAMTSELSSRAKISNSIACTSTNASGSDSDTSSDEDEPRQVVQRIDRCLRKLSFLYTNHVVHKLFRRHADKARESDGKRAISMEQFVTMSPEVAEKLKVPACILGDLATVFERFDFDNDGLLDKRECTRAYRSMLWQQRKELGGRKIEVEVPSSTIENKGYRVENELGRGGQGVMYLCSKQGAAKPFCVKFYEKESADSDGLDGIIEEYAMMKAFKNQHIARTYEVFQDEQHYYLVNEVYFGGDLTKIALRAHEQEIEIREAWWRNIFWQCLDGLNYLHSQAIMHCDIKEPNIMVADESYEEPRIVLIDFGLSAAFSHTARGASGTPGYIPPETYATGWWYPRGDIFSMGVMFFQMMVGQVPRDDISGLGVLQADGDTAKIIECSREVRLPWDRFPGSFPLLAKLINEMTQKDRRDRPSAADALEHEWFDAESNAELPPETLKGLLGTGSSHVAQDRVITQLSSTCNLHELRCLNWDMQEADVSQKGSVPKDQFIFLLTSHGVSREAASALGRAYGQKDGTVQYARVLKESIEVKERYAEHFLQDLFEALDTTHCGMLHLFEIRTLLESDAVEIPEKDIEELMEEMRADEDGLVSFAEFRRAMLEDGRIATRAVLVESIRDRVGAGRGPCCLCS